MILSDDYEQISHGRAGIYTKHLAGYNVVGVTCVRINRQ